MSIEIQTEVIALDEAGVTLQRTMTMDAAALADAFGETTADLEVKVEEFSFDGGGEMRVEFNSLSPQGDMSMDFHVDMIMSGDEGGEPHSADLAMDMTMSMAFEKSD